jgi:ubiquinone/menaquinone biosynthesis C-methylase UbiE
MGSTAAAAAASIAHDTLARVYASSDVSATRDLYDQWARTYDQEMADKSQNYVGPSLASACVLKSLGPDNIGRANILDAGCGTGLVGLHLARAGAKNIDGIDLSPGMLDIARDTGVYKSLAAVDMSKPMPQSDNSYKVVVCIGTFTQGHVGPEPMSELVRITEKTGLIVATVLASIWETGGYAAKVATLADEGKVKVVSTELSDYRQGAGVQARMVILQVL